MLGLRFSVLEHSVAQGFDHGRNAGGDGEFAQDVADVEIDRALLAAQDLADFPRCLAVGAPEQHLLFTGGQPDRTLVRLGLGG